MNIVLVAEARDDWIGNIEGVQIVDPSDYLANPAAGVKRGTRVYNLCRSYAYQSMGYYVSLLAEARGQRAVPDITTIQDLGRSGAVNLIPQSLDELMQKSLSTITAKQYVLSVYFGENLAKKYDRLSKELYGLFRAPLLRFNFSQSSNGKWRLRGASAIALNEVPKAHREFVAAAAKQHFHRPGGLRNKREAARYDLAILQSTASAKQTRSRSL